MSDSVQPDQGVRIGTPSAIEALSSCDRAERRRALHAVNELTLTLSRAAARKALAEETMLRLREELSAGRLRSQVTAALWIGAILLLYFTLGVTLVGFGWLLFPAGWAMRDRQAARRRDALLLGTSWDPRAVGVLAMVVEDGDDGMYHIATDGLRALLPRVRASDADWIDPEQMAALLRLAWHGDDDLRIALLEALRQVGDERALPAVQYLATQTGGDVAVRRSALDCLTYLEQRVRAAHESATLLRASADARRGDSLELLRPGASAGEQSGVELLRSSTAHGAP